MNSPLKQTRLRRNGTLADVALAVGTNTGNLSRIENGKQKASPKLAEKLAKYFGYEITEIQVLYPERFTVAAVAANGVDV
jgi:putative transcriptional regulator